MLTIYNINIFLFYLFIFSGQKIEIIKIHFIPACFISSVLLHFLIPFIFVTVDKHYNRSLNSVLHGSFF